jgi:hypothetical protein
VFEYKWMEEDLAKVDHATQWLVVTSHRPMYSSMKWSAADFVMNDKIRESLEPLFVKYKVDVFLCGHMHDYERTCPVSNGSCQGTYDKPGIYFR